MKKYSVIILAAGLGSRLKSDIPKVFHRVGGLSLLDHLIQTAGNINSEEIVVVLNPKYGNIELKFDASIKKAYQKVQKGTADAVACGLNVLNNNESGWVYILYGDTPLISPETLLRLAEVAQKCENTAVAVLAMDSGDTQDLGKLEPAEEKETIKNIIEAKDADDFDKVLPLCNSGLLIRKDILKRFLKEIKPSVSTGELYITKMVKLAYEAGYVCRYYRGDKNELLGANTRFELALIEKKFQERERKKHLDNGVTLVAPETVFFSHDTTIESEVTVHPYVVFGENVHLKSGAQIGPFCVVEGAVVDNARVGPFARLRNGTKIENEAQIGNFVEIKNSQISQGTKVNHLSYIGDTTIGKNTNIGAGTITCNYDGFKKHKTSIGENVFVGSNTALVAPVQIQDNATIGAGSVVVKNVKNGELGISRVAQKNIPHWSINFRKRKKCAE
ncbi:MAG: bifunctional UDP-N-acetylglucosamine diphosphorylase/glucosamine-1-phosphate N-acetyltransferase GlmU [Holosporaceae bacterium]|jgi:bifunctional UDP-N-acetylglucosamine pyrophosphorylase/glucosamine-1-phosphate N-acetyltransferase|nr:bifunctional UDP-N-acetylglucosamine diphosphorylase/glucosamine-1-phosphate N-acetyltransferase GlmU [Holosporaceae bacterium]